MQHDDAIRDLYKLKFELGRFRVGTARCGWTGLKLFSEFNPDIVLMDMHLPFLSGIEAIERFLQERKLHQRQPRIIFTANLDKQIAAKKIQHLKVDAYILKAEHTPSQILAIVNGITGAKA